MRNTHFRTKITNATTATSTTVENKNVKVTLSGNTINLSGAIVAGAGGYASVLVDLTTDVIKPDGTVLVLEVLAFILYLMGAVMSFATGTSWGTMAILFPIGMPMAINLGVSLPVISAAIISGSVVGDHCSPISDTTIMASIGAACDHIDHFETQMPYAVTAGIVCGILFLIAGWISTPVTLVGGIVVLVPVIYVLHKMSVKKNGQVKTPEQG